MGCQSLQSPPPHSYHHFLGAFVTLGTAFVLPSWLPPHEGQLTVFQGLSQTPLCFKVFRWPCVVRASLLFPCVCSPRLICLHTLPRQRNGPAMWTHFATDEPRGTWVLWTVMGMCHSIPSLSACGKYASTPRQGRRSWQTVRHLGGHLAHTGKQSQTA